MTVLPSVIKVLCVDDHPLIREGIRVILEGEETLQLTATASCGREALAKFDQHRPDVTLMDLRLPDLHGAEVIARLRQKHCDARIVALTTYPGDVQAMRALRAGAMGYLLKSTLRTELITTIHAVHAGQRRISPEVAADISEHIATKPLSEREVEVLLGASAGHTNKVIAGALHLSQETVQAHLKNIFVKLGAADRTQAVVIAMRRGYLLP